MSIPESLDKLIEPLKSLQSLLDRYKGQGVIIGGIANGFLGKPRLTVDLDAMFLASIKDIPNILELAEKEGIEPRIDDVVAFAKKSRVLLLHHKKSKVNIDISLGIMVFEEEVVTRSVKLDAGALTVQLPTPEDFIIMKAVAHRPKDFLDIKEVVATHPNLDKKRIKKWVTDFAEVLEMPDLWKQIEAILNGEE